MIRRPRLAWLPLAALVSCGTERVEHHYRPEWVAQNAGRPSEEVFYKPDGTKVVISSRLPGAVDAPAPAAATDAAGAASSPPAPGTRAAREPVRAQTPDLVLEVFMTGLRDETYDDLYDRLVSPQQRERMGGETGRAAFVKFCQDNRRELMASALRLVATIRGGESRAEQVGSDMMRYRMPDREKGQFGFTVLEVERTPTGLGLAGMR